MGALGPGTGSGYNIDYICMSFEEILKRLTPQCCMEILYLVKFSRLVEYALRGLCCTDDSVRRKSYTLFEVWWKLVRHTARRDDNVQIWFFVLESLRLSIRWPFEILDE